MKPFPQYAQAVNQICLYYDGMIPEYAVALNYVIPFIHKTYPDLEVSLYVNPVHRGYAASISEFDVSSFGWVKRFLTDPNDTHPILKFIQGSRLSFPSLPVGVGETCFVCPDAAYPSRSLSTEQVKRIRGTCAVVGSDLHPSYSEVDYRPSGADKIKILSNANWVVGSENEYVFLAAAMGIRTTLIPTGPGTDLFRTLFPHGEVNERL